MAANTWHNFYMITSKRDPVVLERRFIPKGSVIIRQGEEGNSAFLIQSGKVSIYTKKQDEDHEIVLAEIGTGAIFGEMALLFDGPRTASAKALDDCNLIVLTRQVFDSKMEKSDPTVRALLKMLTERIINSNNTVINKKSDIGDLTDTAHIIYDNILQGLPRTQQRPFENTVLPKLEAFLKSIGDFRERFEEDEDQAS